MDRYGGQLAAEYQALETTFGDPYFKTKGCRPSLGHDWIDYRSSRWRWACATRQLTQCRDQSRKPPKLWNQAYYLQSERSVQLRWDACWLVVFERCTLSKWLDSLTNQKGDWQTSQQQRWPRNVQLPNEVSFRDASWLSKNKNLTVWWCIHWRLSPRGDNYQPQEDNRIKT
jgi:hypothetical protein